ncbi:helix-turn-helix transcriptional regulator [Nonomuraea sp. NPDC049714]|uniref:helix-turn-helix transcriptional regulator n=1 Tax=Nonomuraea sp. NPDC049714 TaxID=3364357 RepID=UPI00378FAD07
MAAAAGRRAFPGLAHHRAALGRAPHRLADLAAHVQPSPRTHRTGRPTTRQPRHQPHETEQLAQAAAIIDGSRVEHTTPPFLDDIQDAVIRGVQTRLGYVDGDGSGTERIVHALGVVAKGPTWYLVTNTDAGRRTFRIDRVSSVEPTDDPVHRPEVGASTIDGRIEVVIRGYNEYALAGELAGLVEWLEVTDPPGERDHLTLIGKRSSSDTAETAPTIRHPGPVDLGYRARRRSNGR